MTKDEQIKGMANPNRGSVGVQEARPAPVADERNKLAAWMIAQGYATGHGDTIEQLLDELRWQVRESERDRATRENAYVLAEREACALVCINIANKPSNVILGVAIDCAAAIRART